MRACLDNAVTILDLDNNINSILKNNNITNIKELWVLKRNDLKDLGLRDNQINQIVIKLQLKGLDLNKKVYDNY